VIQCASSETAAFSSLKMSALQPAAILKLPWVMLLHLTLPNFCAGMISGSAPRPAMTSGEWGSQASAVRVTCAPTASAMNRPVQAGLIRNPTASIPLRPSSQPGPRQMLPSQVMNMGKCADLCLSVCAGLSKVKQQKVSLQF